MRLVSLNFLKRAIKRFSLLIPFRKQLKTYLLKLLLTDAEKRFFWLIAPEDSTKTDAENGYLWQWNWLSSMRSHDMNMPLTDKKGLPIPWFTFPAIQFLRARVSHHTRVFEYGSGSSTLFFASFAKEVHALEHDARWYNSVSQQALENVFLYQTKLDYGGDYCQFVAKIERHFDIISIDGRDRVNCCLHAHSALTDGGVIILDDSHRDKYKDGVQYLLNQGFKHLPFYGLRQGTSEETCTSIFYRADNILGI